jgi:hypothetical protein
VCSVSVVLFNLIPMLYNRVRRDALYGHTAGVDANLNHIPAICNVNPDDNKINVAANGIVYGLNKGK